MPQRIAVCLRTAAAMAVLLLGACAQYAPVPGGGDDVNKGFYRTPDDFRTRIQTLAPGMGESQVLDILGRNRNDLTLLSREEVVKALYGGSAVQMMDSAAEREETRAFLQSLYGYRLQFKDVDRHIGFSSPIRINTKEDGFDYAINLIFQNGILLERPVVSGGVVNGNSSRTFFDYFTPTTVLSRLP